MEIATLLAAVAALGLPCSNPELRDFPAEQMPWPAAYVRTIEGHNIIALRDWTGAGSAELPDLFVAVPCANRESARPSLPSGVSASTATPVRAGTVWERGLVTNMRPSVRAHFEEIFGMRIVAPNLIVGTVWAVLSCGAALDAEVAFAAGLDAPSPHLEGDS
jgi:hypothetical protein